MTIRLILVAALLAGMASLALAEERMSYEHSSAIKCDMLHGTVRLTPDGPRCSVSHGCDGASRTAQAITSISEVRYSL